MKSETCQLLCVDFGSTSIKVGTFSVSQTGNLEETAKEQWIDYAPDIGYTNDSSPFHLLTPEHLNALLHTLHNQIQTYKNAEQSPENPILIISGLTNTLAITYKGATALLLDDPSLTVSLTHEEEIIISRTCGASGTRSASSLMKLLALKKHPEILTNIFQSIEPIPWNDVTYSTILSVITERITKTHQRYTIPFDDVRAFGSRFLSPNQTRALLETLQILPSKYAIAPSRIVKTSYGLVYQINDFQAEASLVSRLFELGLIPQTACVLSLDTVGKIMTKYLTNNKTIADISYDTLRNSGRVVKTWIKTLINPQEQHVLYEEMERILIQNPQDFGYHFYPSVQNANEGLLIGPDGSQFRYDDIAKIPEKHKHNVIVAVVRGVGWELRTMIQTCLNKNDILDEVPVVLYGGLTGHNQHGWIDTLAYALPTSRGLYMLPLTNGMLAAAVSAVSEITALPNASLSFSLHKISDKKTEEKKYNIWLSQRPS